MTNKKYSVIGHVAPIVTNTVIITKVDKTGKKYAFFQNFFNQFNFSKRSLQPIKLQIIMKFDSLFLLLRFKDINWLFSSKRSS